MSNPYQRLVDTEATHIRTILAAEQAKRALALIPLLAQARALLAEAKSIMGQGEENSKEYQIVTAVELIATALEGFTVPLTNEQAIVTPSPTEEIEDAG